TRLLIAARTVFSGTSLRRIISASLRSPSSENPRASATSSCTCFGRPPGLPDTPLGKWPAPHLALGLSCSLADLSKLGRHCHSSPPGQPGERVRPLLARRLVVQIAFIPIGRQQFHVSIITRRSVTSLASSPLWFFSPIHGPPRA